MKRFAQQLATFTLCLLMAMPAWPADAEEPNGAEMAADLVLARPIGVAFAALGTAAFVVSLPFTALGGNVKQAADKLVVEPGREVFVRCLGCPRSGRYVDPNSLSE